MADTQSKKKFYGQQLNTFAEKKISDAYQLLGKALPCTVVSRKGQIVTVNFEVNSLYTLDKVTIPVATSAYLQAPLRPGDPGVVLPADAYLGGVSGLGGGVADLTRRSNLSALVFVPIANTSFASPDTNAVLVQGPDGVIVQDMGAACKIVLTPTTINMNAPTSITLTVGGYSLVINSSGVAINGAAGGITINGKSYEAHEHGGVMAGTAYTGPVYNP